MYKLYPMQISELPQCFSLKWFIFYGNNIIVKQIYIRRTKLNSANQTYELKNIEETIRRIKQSNSILNDVIKPCPDINLLKALLTITTMRTAILLTCLKLSELPTRIYVGLSWVDVLKRAKK